MSENKKNFKYFHSIDLILNNLGTYYKIIKNQYELHSGGGSQAQAQSQSQSQSHNNFSANKKYYKKYKSLIKSSAQSINYYKNLIQLQASNQMKLNNYYQNLIGMLKSQRERLATGYQVLGNDFKNEKEKISMLETMITGLEKYIQSSKNFDINVKKIILKGGALEYMQFQDNIMRDMQDLSTHITKIDEDKNFLEKKITSLHERMTNIITKNDELFKIKAEIEWIVNQLENVDNSIDKASQQDFEELYGKIQKMIGVAKTQGAIDQNIADYIHKLEEYASYLENFIKSNEKTLGSIKIDKINPKDDTVNEKIQIDDQIKSIANKITNAQDQIKTNTNTNTQGQSGGTSNTLTNLNNIFSELIGGGALIDKYNEKSNTMIDKLKKIFTHTYDNIQIDNADIIVNILNNNLLYEKPDLYGKIVTIAGLLIKLDQMVKEYNSMYMYFSNNDSLLSHDETSNNNLIEMWKEMFKTKNTEYYTEKLLNFQIYFYNYVNTSDKNISLENALKNLINKTSRKPIINFKDKDINKDIDTIIDKLNNTVISFDHLNIFFQNLILTLLLQSSPDEKTRSVDVKELILKLQNNILIKKDRLLKSALGNKSDVYSVLYENSNNNTQVGGNMQQIAFPQDPLTKITNTDAFIEFFKLYSSSIFSSSNEKPLIKTNQTQIDKTIQLSNMMISLYNKINLKLGVTDDNNTSVALSQEEKSINTYSEFSTLIKSEDKTIESTNATPELNKDKINKSASKPRLDIYRNKLISCRDELNPYMKKIAILRNLLSKTKDGNFSTDETMILIGLYTKIKKQIEEGINSYIKLIPMIFFTIEFPPVVYATQQCKYKFAFDAKKELVEYKFIENQDKKECDKLELGTFKDEEFVSSFFPSHAAFFESNKLNGTKKLIDDPVIGLGKLIKQDENGSNPISATINMMFALGASGTGKTTRYFGKSNGHPDDQEGIVPYIINKSIEDAKSSEPNAKPTKQISIAYFVCYGQKSQIDSTNAEFNELVIFFNINEIIKSNNGDKTITKDTKYIPYYMPKTANIPNDIANNYTNFYSFIVSKNLERKKYSELENFITNGKDFPKSDPKSNSDHKTFRELIESTNEIWKTIDHTESSSIGELFEKLIIEQKKINTVLPTKNNIESSRGHTCVLVKIEDMNEKTTMNKVKYFPLFDMAGTENTKQINSFLKEGRNTINMAKLVKKVNTITQENDIVKQDDENKQYPSLNDLLKYDNISKWVSSSAKSKYLTIESVGGAKQKIKIDDFYSQVTTSTDNPGDNFLDKIVKEGYYINHTISMLIFAAMCVGSSLKTELIGDKDYFNDFLPELFKEINKFTCVPSVSGVTECIDKTMMLLSEKSVSAIANSSCIWLQILFSFLYWNEETPKSITKLLQNINIDTTKKLSYLCEPNVQNSQIKIDDDKGNQVDIMTVAQLYDFKNKTKSIDLQQITKLYQMIKNINANYSSSITSKVSDIIIENNKLKIKYEKIGSTSSIASDFTYDLKDKVKVTGKIYYDFFKDNERVKKLDEFKNLIEKYLKTIEKLTDDQIVMQSRQPDSKIKPDAQNIIDIFNSENFFPINNQKSLPLVLEFKYDSDDQLAKYTNFGFSNRIKEKLTNLLKIINIIKDVQKNQQTPASGIVDVISTIDKFNNDPQTDYTDIIKLLTVTNSHLQYNDNSAIKFDLIKTNNAIPIDNVFNSINKFNNLQTCPNNNLELNKLLAENQMHRVRDGRVAATKMTLMHLVTGQGIKHFMVGETVKLCTTLYNSTNLDLAEK